MNTKINNMDKILFALYNADESISLKELAMKAGVSASNISKTLKNAYENNWVISRIVQNGKIRSKLIFLTPNGIKYISPRITEISDSLDEQEFNEIVDKAQTKDDEIASTKLIYYINSLVIRKVDYSKFGFKDTAEMRTEMINLVFKLKGDK